MNIDLNDTVPDKDRPEPKPEELTCFACELRKTCEFVDDPYNTDGDCLASK